MQLAFSTNAYLNHSFADAVSRLAALAQRRGERGPMSQTACFFKSPVGVTGHDFGKQFQILEEYLDKQPGRV